MVETRTRTTEERELNAYELHHRRLGNNFSKMLGLGIFMAILAALLYFLVGKTPQVADNTTDTSTAVTSEVGDAAGNVTAKVGELGSGAIEGGQNAVGAVGDAADNVTAKVGELGSGAIEGGKDAVGAVGDAAGNVTAKVGDIATGIGLGKSLDFLKSGKWGVNQTVPLKVDAPIEFEYNSAVLTSNGKKVVVDLAQEINQLDAEQVSIKVMGHSSKVGDAQHNQNLSSQRADAVAKELTNLGVKQELSTEGKGFSSPLAGIAPDDVRQQRTEVYLTRLK